MNVVLNFDGKAIELAKNRSRSIEGEVMPSAPSVPTKLPDSQTVRLPASDGSSVVADEI